MKIAHISITPLAGSPIRIINAINKTSTFQARLITFDIQAYGERVFENDLDWKKQREESISVLESADILHFHHFFDFTNNVFNIDFTKFKGKKIRQYHTSPYTIAKNIGIIPENIINDEIPQLVISQFHERYYPRAVLVPNIIPIFDQDYSPALNDFPKSSKYIFFSPTASISVFDSRWDTKGAPETIKLVNQIVQNTALDLEVISNQPHKKVLHAKKNSYISIDEVVTGSYHISSLESLSQGVPTLCYLDKRTEAIVREITSCYEDPLPWLNFHLTKMDRPIKKLINDINLRNELGKNSRQWVEKYWNEGEMIKFYLNAYINLVEKPFFFQRLRYSQTKTNMWFIKESLDLEWEASRDDIKLKNYLPTTLKSKNVKKIIKLFINGIKNKSNQRLNKIEKKILSHEKRIQNLEEVLNLLDKDNESSWLYRNRKERLDALVDDSILFDKSRQNFHIARYIFATQFTKNKSVADIACGTGYGTRILIEQGAAKSCIGIDISSEAIEYANRNHNVPGSCYICASADKTPFEDNSIDIVVSFETIEHLPNDKVLLMEFHRIIKSGGLLICSTPNQWPLSIAPFHTKEYDLSEFKRVLSNFFQIEQINNQNSGTDWEFNHGQPAGIVSTKEENKQLAECYIAVCKKV